MSSTWGTNIKISIFGESHSKGIGVVIDGIPAGTRLDPERLLHFLARRSSRGGKLDTPAHRKGLSADHQRAAAGRGASRVYDCLRHAGVRPDRKRQHPVQGL